MKYFRGFSAVLILVTCSYVAGYKFGVDEGIRVADSQLNSRLKYVEERLGIVSKQTFANTDSLEVVVSSLATAHRNLLQVEGMAGDTRSALVSLREASYRRK